MEKKTKIVLGILAGLLVLGICACVGGWIALRGAGRVLEDQMMLDEPDRAGALARSLIDYDLPPGYQEQGAINMGLMQMIIIGVGGEGDSLDSSRPVIMIVGVPENMPMDEEEMALQIQQSMEEENLDMRLVEQSTTTIRGQEVPLLTYEGANDQGVEMRQLISGLFEGKKGSVMLMILGEESGWNQGEVDAFIDSIE